MNCEGRRLGIFHDQQRRCCTPDDVAETMLSLVLSNRFVTGEIIVIDGGFSSTT